MKFYTKIEAIKALRNIPCGEASLAPVPSIDGTFKIRITGGGLGLKEAKDLCEGIMEMGVRYHLEETKNSSKEIIRQYLQDELNRLYPIPQCNRCGEYLDYPQAPQPCSSCYKEQMCEDNDIQF